MDRRTHIPVTELAAVYNAIEFYIKYRYEEIGVEDLKVIRRLLNKIEEDYHIEYPRDTENFEDVRKRKAGRKTTYSSENEKEIVRLHSEGTSLRKIAEKTGSTLGRVNAVLKKYRDGNKSLKKDDRFWDILDTWIEQEENAKKADNTSNSGC